MRVGHTSPVPLVAVRQGGSHSGHVTVGGSCYTTELLVQAVRSLTHTPTDVHMVVCRQGTQRYRLREDRSL